MDMNIFNAKQNKTKFLSKSPVSAFTCLSGWKMNLTHSSTSHKATYVYR